MDGLLCALLYCFRFLVLAEPAYLHLEEEDFALAGWDNMLLSCVNTTLQLIISDTSSDAFVVAQLVRRIPSHFILLAACKACLL